MQRGELVAVVIPGDCAKPCPALIIQANPFEHTGTVTALPLSGTLVDAPRIRLTVQPNRANFLRKPSQVMVDKAIPVKRARAGPSFGVLDDQTMLSVSRTLAVFLGIA